MTATRVVFTFAGVSFDLRYNSPVEVTDHFLPFLGEPGPVCCRADFRLVPRLPALTGQTVFSCRDYCVLQTADGGLLRFYFDGVTGGPPYAAASCDPALRRVEVQYLPGAERFLSETSNSFFHLGWERLLIQEGRLILHAACVDTPYGGLLFSGPSGIGKSTQAELWRRYAGGTLINGDRPVLYRAGAGWTACGSPYAGSSHCHVNASCPVRAAILLRQAPACSLRRLAPAEAFRRLFAGCAVYSYDAGFVSRACDLVQSLAAAVPVYELSCTPDRAAVELLRRALTKEAPL